jgi:hypothetical protein
MEMNLLLASTALLAIAMLLRVKRDRAAVIAHRQAAQQRLVEVAQEAELTKKACFASLENLNQRLAQLQSQANAAEGKLNVIVEPAMVERKENYRAAGLLLADGQSVARVSSILGLPVSEVELIVQLQKMVAKEAPAVSAQPNGAAEKPAGRRRKKVAVAAKALDQQRPILLTDSVKPEYLNGSNLNGHHAELNGFVA